MSPDALVLGRAIDRLVARARLVTAIEAAGFGVVVASWRAPAGLAAAVFVAVVRSRHASRRRVISMLERANPGLRNLIVTADEIRDGTLSARPHIADRVFRDAIAGLRSADHRVVSQPWRVASLLFLAASVWLASATFVRRSSLARPSGKAVAGETTPTGVAGGLQVSVTIHPPAYTRLPSTTVVNPVELRPVEYSLVEFTVRSGASNVSFEVNGVTRAPASGPDGGFIDRETVTQSGYAIVTAGDGGRRMMTISVIPDALPAIRIVAPGKDLAFADGNPRLLFGVEATDDFGLRSMALRFTKVSGSGEQFEFKEGEIPLTIERSSAVAWKGAAQRSLRDFGLIEGDMLVYRAVASDGRPGTNEATSDAYFIEMSRFGAAAGDAFTLPEEETRYALSQQMLIVKTERLVKSRGAIGAGDFTETARGLAIEQRMIRTEFVFMLGGEIEDEAIEAAQSTELQEGRLANRGQRDLRAATVAMSQAEKHLTDANPEDALEKERVAVAALQRAFSRDRYILRALATRTPLDPSRRLTGAIAAAIGWRRQIRESEDDRQTLHLLGLLQSLGEFSSAPVTSESERQTRLSMLAELALRTNARSEVLRQAATSLQILADRWPALDSAERLRRLDSVTAGVADAARGALADPQMPVGTSR